MILTVTAIICNIYLCIAYVAYIYFRANVLESLVPLKKFFFDKDEPEWKFLCFATSALNKFEVELLKRYKMQEDNKQTNVTN